MRLGWLAVVALCATIGAGGAEAQSLSVEAGMGLAVPTGAVAERWGVGLEYGAGAALELTPRYAFYTGYSYTFFDLDFVDDLHAVDTGFSLGVRRSFPGSGRVAPWVRSGLLIHSLELQGERTGDDGGLGFEVGGGIMLRHKQRRAVRANLAVAYRRYDARVLGPDRETVSYFSAGVTLGGVFSLARKTEAQR
jgi:hypothetical protein